jgi:small subunit ribosomal protein S16
MAVKLRLARHGAKKAPYYRLIAAQDQSRRDGRFLEHVGSYDPTLEPPAVSLKRDRIRYWLDQGALATPTAKSLLAKYMGVEDTATLSKPKPKVVPPVIVTPEPAPAPKAAAPAPAEATDETVETAAVPADAPPAAEVEAAPAEG